MSKKYYEVIIVPIEDQGDRDYVMQFTDKEIKILQECTKIAKDEDLSLQEILETEGYDDLLQHIYDECDIPDPDGFIMGHQVLAVDLDNPLEL